RIHRSRIGLALDDADQRMAVELREQLEALGLEHLRGPSQASEVNQSLQAFEEDIEIERRRAGTGPDGPVRRSDAARPAGVLIVTGAAERSAAQVRGC